MTTPQPPFGNTSIWETWPSLPSHGPAPGIPVVQGQRDGSYIWLPLSTFGASGDDAFWCNFAFSQLPSVPLASGLFSNIGYVNMPATTAGHKTSTTVNVPPLAYLVGQGPGSVINYSGNGDGIFMQNPVPTGGPNYQLVDKGWAGGFRDLVIDGTSAGANGCGWHTDSIPNGLQIRHVRSRNFTGVNGLAWHMSNNISFTEQADVDASSYNCTQCGLIEKLAGGSESFRYNVLKFYFSAFAGQTGIVIQAAHLTFGRLWISCNMASSSSPISGTMLHLTNVVVGGQIAQIASQLLEFLGEVNLGLANTPQTIFFDSASAANNNILNCTGRMLFQNGFTPSNILAANNAFTFGGTVQGDANLVAANNIPAGWL